VFQGYNLELSPQTPSPKTEMYALKNLPGGNFTSLKNMPVSKTVKGVARVCQKHVGEFAFGDPARHYRLLVESVFMIVCRII
jgi:hypothetical protein